MVMLRYEMCRLWMVSALLLTAAACSSGSAAPDSEPMHREVTIDSRSKFDGAGERGKLIFLDYCSFCHDVSTNARADAGRGLVRAASGATMSTQDIRALLADPPAGMPKLPLQTEQEAELIEYLLSVPKQSLYTQFDHP